MFLFGLEGSGFIIAVALTLLVSGAIMFYCLKRFSVVETAITEQGKILQSFIQNSQTSGGLASPVAIDAARQQCELSPTNEETENNIKTFDLTNNLFHEENIEVSDDDSESDSEEDSDDDSDDDNLENLNILNKEKQINIESEGLLETLSVQDIVISKISEDADVKLVASQVIQVDGLTGLNLNKDDLNIEENLLNNLDLPVVEEVSDTTDEVKLEKLKVGDLRNLVVEKNLVEDSSKVSKMKKEELLKLLN
jgi:hypothetical protein